jgi:NADPH-dependent curcumin reductase CurA
VLHSREDGVIPRTHRQIRLAARLVGYPTEGDFRLVESPVPEPGPGEFLVRVVYLSLDPYNFGRMIVRVGPEPAATRASRAAAGRETERSG